MTTDRCLSVLVVLLALSVLTVAASGVVTAQEQDTVSISDPSDFDDIREDLDGDYVLTNDIDLSDVPDFEPIGDGNRGDRGQEPFTGTFDGNGYTVTGMTVSRSDDYVGLFGAVGRNGEVASVGLEDISVEGKNRVGGIVGFNRGNVTDSYVDGTVSGSGDYVGGVVGWNRGNVTRSYSLASVRGELEVGGIAGRSDGGGTVSQTYAAGPVSATGARAGGLVGNLGSQNQFEEHNSVLRNSYWDTDATGQSEEVGRMRAGEGEVTIENVEGLTTSEIQGTDVEERMTAFDFAGTWEATEDYPVLSWQASILPGEDTPLPGFGLFAGIFALFVAVLLRVETRRRTDNS